MRQFYVTLLVMFLAGLGTQSAFGYVEFHKAWLEMYVDESDESEKATEYKDLVSKGKYKCLVCHQGKKKSFRNVYGDLVDEKLSKDDKKDAKKIEEALAEIGKMKVDSDDENSMTYDEKIAKFELPGGTLEDLQENPEE